MIPRLLSAKLQSHDLIVLTFDSNVEALDSNAITIAPEIHIREFERRAHQIFLHTERLDIKTQHIVAVDSGETMNIFPDGIFNSYHSQKLLGWSREDGMHVFRVFVPRAYWVRLVVFTSLEDSTGNEFDMTRDNDGIWEIALDGTYVGHSYGYRVAGPRGEKEMFDSSLVLADPYARAIVSRNDYRQESRALFVHDEFDWSDDGFIPPMMNDLIIYEMHVRDQTAHPSSGVDRSVAGSYRALTEHGVEYVRSLGVNAVELLPSQHFAAIEPPYREPAEQGVCNTWNPYERNHWGYMTSYFFAPHARYASGAPLAKGEWCDAGGRQVREFKEMVRAFHRAGIAVIMDVVYNHTSQYDRQPLKHIDRFFYYRVDANGDFESRSGCGNDFHTARPMARRLIVDSLIHWMTEYHVDGFRFDLATMIDWETMEAIRDATRRINPHVILIAEPWGGGMYDLAGFSARGIGAWNDIVRNEVKGSDPVNGRGFIFGTWERDALSAFKKWILGSTHAHGGPFIDASHAVNYLESHDGYTLGDFIRIALGEASVDSIIDKSEMQNGLNELQRAINKLAAFVLFISKGAVMMHEGQEYARGKVIAQTNAPDAAVGRLDHNSYEKDDETNWIDYDAAALNRELVEYYRGLCAIRRAFPELRTSPDHHYSFYSGSHPNACGFTLCSSVPQEKVIVAVVNSSTDASASFDLPDGLWSVIVDGRSAGLTVLRKAISGTVTLQPTSGMLLVREYEAREG